MRTRFRPDRELTTRIGVTVFLLGLLYVALRCRADRTFFRSWVLVVLIAGGFLFAQYFFSDRIALLAMGGRM